MRKLIATLAALLAGCALAGAVPAEENNGEIIKTGWNFGPLATYIALNYIF